MVQFHLSGASSFLADEGRGRASEQVRGSRWGVGEDFACLGSAVLGSVCFLLLLPPAPRLQLPSAAGLWQCPAFTGIEPQLSCKQWQLHCQFFQPFRWPVFCWPGSDLCSFCHGSSRPHGRFPVASAHLRPPYSSPPLKGCCTKLSAVAVQLGSFKRAFLSVAAPIVKAQDSFLPFQRP